MRPEISVITGVDPFGIGMRVLHVWAPGNGRVAEFATTHAGFQAERGWEVHTACPTSDLPAGVCGHHWSAGDRPLSAVRTDSDPLAHIVAEVAPDAVVGHGWIGGLVARWAVRGMVPTVVVPLGTPAHPIPGGSTAVLWEKRVAGWTNAVVAVHEAEAEARVRRGIRAPLFLAHDPVDRGLPDDPDITLMRMAAIISRAHAFGR